MEEEAASTTTHATEQASSPPSRLQSSAAQNAPNPDVMAQFLAHFDPLAMLEAEYAAVLAQSSSKHGDAADSRDTNQQHKADSDDENSDDDGDDARDAYAQVPMSPTGSDAEYYQPLGDDSDDDDGSDDGSEDDKAGECATAAAMSESSTAVAHVPQLDIATRNAVMQSMQRLTLQPPSWAKDTNLSDDDLVAMVQRQLQQ